LDLVHLGRDGRRCPPAPSADRSPSRFRSAVSVDSRAFEGAALSVTTIWSASAVVVQAGQLALRASASLMGAIAFVRPTIRTT
jgi:hypothetical protein